MALKNLALENIFQFRPLSHMYLDIIYLHASWLYFPFNLQNFLVRLSLLVTQVLAIALDMLNTGRYAQFKVLRRR